MDNFLLDTTYILPYFGIHVDLEQIKEKLRIIQKDYKEKAKITTCSLIEAKWKAIRMYKKEEKEEYLTRANTALLSFGMGKYYDVINPWFVPGISESADELLRAGHEDYMDCWIFATAKTLGYKIISEDEEILRIIDKLEGWEALKVHKWKEFTLT